MESTVSVSKGVFLFPSTFKKPKNAKHKTNSLFEKQFKKEPWYKAYKKNWEAIETRIMDASAIESEDETTPTKKLKKNQCTMTTLQNWYRSKYLNSSPKKKHTVSMRSLVLEDIFLNYTSPLHLSGKAFELLTDVFLFYDFSVTGLIQSIKLQNASTEATILTQTADEAEYDMEVVPGNRYKLKEQLLRATRVDKVQSEFEMIRARFVSYLEEMFAEGLQPPFTQTFHEILFFSDVASVKKQIVGAPRGAVHTALSNPVQYLQIVIAALALVAVVVAAPAEQPAKVVNILRSEHDLQPDGAYHYNFETEDGTSRNENGELKVVNDAENKPQQVLTVRGSYSYVDPEGHSHSVTYVADETGFHAESNDLSKTQS
ncbi:hypothetical protein MSG28_007518 [Choristoneura fumiferana]|uniref:Uncharacterized protein n=1 Tax=Choristoneura fumiferana TaxID=7141 RepID=A0ACC0JXP8_CHOFU|nr:hypothetical protein MSG28_007518 [Choristoneura fumiferana]